MLVLLRNMNDVARIKEEIYVQNKTYVTVEQYSEIFSGNFMNDML